MTDRQPKSIGHTTSLCPVCFDRLDSQIVEEGDEVFLEKTCREHGKWRVIIWRGDPLYKDWEKRRERVQPEMPHPDADDGCPFECGLCRAHRQSPCSVLLEVTTQCNLRCPVCFADTPGAEAARADPDLKTIGWWYDRVMTTAGPCNIQLSGGEPTLRDDLPGIIALGRKKGFSFIQVNTNGIRLAADKTYAKELSDAGLSTVFLQFDGTDDAVYSVMRGRPLFRDKMIAIRNCAENGLGVILVPTLMPGVNTDHIGSIIRLGLNMAPVVRGVHFQPISYFGRYPSAAFRKGRITLPEVINAIEEQTEGLIKKKNLFPPGTENIRCSFHGSFAIMPDGRLFCLTHSAGSCCNSNHSMPELQRTISTVARQWSAPENPLRHSESRTACCRTGTDKTPYRPGGEGPIDLDVFLDLAHNQSFTVSCMAFQDVWNLDLERLRDCCISVVSPDGRLIPFCAYNLSNTTGKTLYRHKKGEAA
jgi:uncharacterized radical SAM superfamily Fe-S cluster-containing enzyme